VTTKLSGHGEAGTVVVELELARGPDAARDYKTFDEWLGMNIWRVKLGAWIHGADGQTMEPVILLDLVRGEAFTPSAATGTRMTATWTPTHIEQREGLLARLLTPHGRVTYGTSVWFVGATGLACCADEACFIQT
jgi:hypothetical protein